MHEKGLNKANLVENITWLAESIKDRSLHSRPCVFLSHKREDKSACRKIADYLKNAGIDYYLDEEDDNLQYASERGDAVRITESIKNGIKNSSHMMVVVSDQTYRSLWVPFEVGYGHAAILDQEKLQLEKNRIRLSVLTLKDIAEKTLPDYLQVGYVIKGTKSLNEYISKITNKLEKSLISENLLFSYNKISHPLDTVLNWKL
ncbi:toll/interleukin-1 receptor domain-containing protein [Flavobacterium lindanitolerans]|uniref:toll/interleukin-1 receptor domain-containing protein n=1 Tax=Flavobacterium lindanitolerans TaxID=428988 RepID=UPI0023F149D2|nr:toll/interleukin-1 receptor domain-containing protein [Flavobacterium lindanitolerans]